MSFTFFMCRRKTLGPSHLLPKLNLPLPLDVSRSSSLRHQSGSPSNSVCLGKEEITHTNTEEEGGGR